MGNSSLVSYTRISPNHTKGRVNVTRITPHCVVGQLSVETIGSIFAPKSRQASSNYGIGSDGRIGMYCEEKNRSWCSSSSSNDNRAITIECASDRTHPYAMNEKVYNSLVNLCVDICHRHGKHRLVWAGSKNAALNYNLKSEEILLTAHRWFSNTACPGDWLYNRLGQLADAVNHILGNKTSYSENDSTQNNPSLDIDGIIGHDTITVWQSVMGTPVDGKITGQLRSLKKYHLSFTGSAVRYDGEGGSKLIKAVQIALKFQGDDVDGQLGPATIKAIQRHLGCDDDGLLGKKTAMAIQQQIFQGVF